MKQKFYKSIVLSALLTCSLASVAVAAGETANYELRAFYGDKVGDKVMVIDVKKMDLIKKVELDPGSTPYPVDRAGYLDKVYAITRNALSMDVIDAGTLNKLGKIPLTHTPRSGEAFNSRLGLALVAGADQPITSLIDVMHDKVVAVTVEDDSDPLYNDYGGGNASGHPAWLSNNKFVVIDRARRLIQLWEVNKVQGKGYGYGSSNYHWKLTRLDTFNNAPTSIHHILKRNTSMLSDSEKRVFYALAEGNQSDGIPPAIVKLRLTDKNKLQFKGQVNLPGNASEMGSHHADFHPNGQHIYVGSTEGRLFVIDKDSGEILKTITTGEGTGHTRFVPALNLAVVTNHNDDFVTVINTDPESDDQYSTTEIPLNVGKKVPVDGEIKQSHTSHVSPDNKFYYAFASAYGFFFELNLKTLKMGRTVDTGGVPVQGSFINSDEFSYSAASSSSGM